jgi:hypothetical protein
VARIDWQATRRQIWFRVAVAFVVWFVSSLAQGQPWRVSAIWAALFAVVFTGLLWFVEQRRRR